MKFSVLWSVCSEIVNLKLSLVYFQPEKKYPQEIDNLFFTEWKSGRSYLSDGQLHFTDHQYKWILQAVLTYHCIFYKVFSFFIIDLILYKVCISVRTT